MLPHVVDLARNRIVNPEAERLIDLATRPLADNAELHLAADDGLRKSLEVHAVNRPEAITEAADSLAIADLHPNRHRWRIALLVITAVVSLPLLAHTAWHFYAIRDLAGITALCDSSLRKNPNLSPQEKLLLFGATDASEPTDQWKPLWESGPDQPAYLAEYALAHHREYGKLSPEILTEAERIDPDNGWFPALAAAGIAKEAVTKQTDYRKSKARLKTPIWKIDNEERLDASLSAIHQLTRKTKFTGYQDQLLRQRIPLLPPRRDFISQIPPRLYMSSQSSTNTPFRKLADVLAAGAQQCAAKGDVPGFRQIIGDWKFLVDGTANDGTMLVDVLVAKVVFTGPAANFRDAAQALGLPDEAAYFARIHDRWQEEVAARDKRYQMVSAEEDFTIRHGSIFGTAVGVPAMGNQVKSPPILTTDDLRPERYGEHAFIERIFSWPAWALLGVCAGMTTLTRFREGSLISQLSARMVDLLRPSDWVWMITGGIVFPVLWYFSITRLTPLSAREWSLSDSFFSQASGQFGSMAISMVILTGAIANWRLSKRGAVIGIGKRCRGIWIMAAVTLACVPIFGVARLWEGLGEKVKLQAPFALATAGIWFIAGFAHLLFGRKCQALRRATLGRIVWPVWVIGMLVLAALVPFHYAEERRWIQQDRIYEISAEFPGPNRYEYEVTQILRRELMESIELPGK